MHVVRLTAGWSKPQDRCCSLSGGCDWDLTPSGGHTYPEACPAPPLFGFPATLSPANTPRRLKIQKTRIYTEKQVTETLTGLQNWPLKMGVIPLEWNWICFYPIVNT